jgi:hypothetical protein
MSRGIPARLADGHKQEQPVHAQSSAPNAQDGAPDEGGAVRETLAPRMLLATPLLIAVGGMFVSRSAHWSDGSFVLGALILLAALALFTLYRAACIDRLVRTAEPCRQAELQALAASECDAQLTRASERALGDAAMRRLPPPYLA